MTELFDSHAHYNDPQMTEKKVTPDLAYAEGVTCILNAGTNLVTSKECLELAEQYPFCVAAVGIHPSDCGKCGELQDAMQTLCSLASHSKAVAIGEIGLDYYWDDMPREVQKQWFSDQMELARELKMPVVIHDREAHGDTFDMICRYPEVIGVMHSYSGSIEMAKEYLKRGWYISFSGVVTFKNAARVREIVKTIPTDRILVETDCPYLSPVPMRGKMNHSGYLHYTAETVAEQLGMDAQEFAHVSAQNAKRLFKLE
ncbi:MAG: TatD family deoxyribonuclease [Ruminococcaceae bacterium]|nr:TatD family deoxyribonuclease [Oscillospiraceae bacterium]